MIAVIVMMFCMILVAVGGYLFMNQPKEGDECEGKDENGNYVIDDEGKCVLDDCASGYYKSGKECLVDQSGEDCVPEGTKDPQGIYLTDQMGGCELSSCESPYFVSGDVCDLKTVSARYVRVERPSANYPDNIINLGEIEVFDKAGTNIALNATVTGGPGVHGAGPLPNLTDGNRSNFAHTSGNGPSFLEVDLGAEKDITKIIIVNRLNCCKDRLEGAEVILKDSTGDAVQTLPLENQSANIMTYDFTLNSPAWEYTDE